MESEGTPAVPTSETYQLAEPPAVQSEPARRPQPRRRPAARRGHRIRDLSVANLLTVGLVLFLLHEVSERWWLGTVLTYVPQFVFLIPTLLLLVVSAKLDRPSLVVNLLSTWLVAGSMMGLSLPLGRIALGGKPAKGMKIVSCNVEGPPRLEGLVREVSKLIPAVVALQGVDGEPALLRDNFPDWNVVHEEGFWIASRHPLRLIDRCRADAFDRVTAVAVEIEAPGGKFVLVNVQQTSAEAGFNELDLPSLLSGRAQQRIHEHSTLRRKEAHATRDFIAKLDGSLPTVVTGDLNMPTSSSIYESYWSDFTNAFDAAGVGFGYTSPCGPRRIWPDNVPWHRFEHVLTSWHWKVEDCQTGVQGGYDHRMIVVSLTRR